MGDYVLRCGTMNPKHLRSLELDAIRARLAAHSSFGASQELARELAPSTDPGEIKSRQQETSEARALLDRQPGLGIGGARDLRPYTRAARIGALLNPPELLDIRATLVSARTLRRNLARSNDLYPRLAFIAAGLDDIPALGDAIGRVLNDRAEVMDEASPDLARIRRELNILRSRMMERLQRMLSSAEFSRWLQEPIITQREGRYVIPVRAEARSRVKGIVHDTSSSGATLFLEPLPVVEMGNRVRELAIEETREIERILRALTAQVAANADELDYAVAAIAQLDLAFAKAKYSEEIGGVEPKINADEGAMTLQLVAARHPLLDPVQVVPVSVELGRGFSILVITGPNTGGKTVTLKTVGLLALMAQAGLHIPAQAGSQMPVYDGIYADIGDEQSIEQSLSTFSSHMTNIIDILKEAKTRSLVLLDELGAGTDPEEGAALASAIMTALLQERVSALVATHFAELKAFAHATPGVENASVEFDVETLAPTYHLTIGLPGRSNAFAIATRLGLDPQIVEEARARLAQSDVDLEKMLAEIKHAKEETARELSRAQAERESAERAASGTRRKLAEIERSQAEILQQARASAHAEIEAARAELNRLRQEWRQVALTREFIERAEQGIEVVEELVEPLRPPSTELGSSSLPPGEPIEVGDQVYVRSLDQMGNVIGVGGGELVVQIGSFRAHLSLDQVELRAKAGPMATQESTGGEVVLPTGESPGMEVHLRGMRADEALDRLDKYLDRAYRAGLPYVRIVHGKGTGTLRRLVREQLSANALVVSFQTADPHEGGEGVTVAKLVSR
jgi:DNA mismatch repair protein MutS2